MKKINNNVEPISEKLERLFNKSELEDICDCIDFYENTEECYCSFLDIDLADISYCKNCLECHRHFENLRSESVKVQEVARIYYLDANGELQEISEDEYWRIVSEKHYI